MDYHIMLYINSQDDNKQAIRFNTANDGSVRFVMRVFADDGEIGYTGYSAASLFFRRDRSDIVTERVCSVTSGGIICYPGRADYDAAGEVRCELQLYGGQNLVVAPLRFRFRVQRTIADPEFIQDIDPSESFSNLLAQMQALYNQGLQMISDLQAQGFVKRAGDTMTGPLTVGDNISLKTGKSAGWAPQLNLYDSAGNNRAVLYLDPANNRTALYPSFTGGGTDTWSQELYYKNTASYFWHGSNLPVEAGTWTPVLRGDSVAGSHTYAAGSTGGFYNRVGNLVSFIARVGLTAKDAAMAGNVQIGGLPFVSVNDTARISACAVIQFAGWSVYPITGMVIYGGNYIRLYKGASVQLAAADVSAASDLAVSGFYRI